MPVSLEQFAQQILDSGVLSADELAASRASSTAADGEQFARELVKQKKLTAFQAQQIYSGRGKGLVLGNYVVLDKLGQGGMGMVLKARHRRMDRLVALKVLSPNVVKTPDLLARFHREVKAAARLEHPNIVIAHDADEARGTHFFVMQYVEGSDLSSVVKKKGPLPVDQAIHCILQAARGLEYAHKHGVIHRDIKPANLLLDGQGTVKILDMGLARIEGETGSQAELTSTGAVMGTVDYMAPEQALSTKSADARSDIYSLGITLWFLLAGRPVYEGDSLMARLLAHREAEIPSLKGIRSEIPAALDSLFRKMIAKSPKDRCQSMSEVIAALEACRHPQSGSGNSAPSLARGPSEDTKLGEFLDLFGSGGDPTAPTVAAPRGKTAVIGPPTAAGSEYEATVTAAPSTEGTDPETLTTLARSRTRDQRASKKTPSQVGKRKQIVAGAGGIGLLAAMSIFWFSSGREANPPASAGSQSPPQSLTAKGPADRKGTGASPLPAATGSPTSPSSPPLAGSPANGAPEPGGGGQGPPRPSPAELLARLGGGLNFDGVDDYVDITSDWRYDGGPLTIEVWTTPTLPATDAIGSVLVNKESPTPSDPAAPPDRFKFIRLRQPAGLGDQLHLGLPPSDKVGATPHFLRSGVPTHLAAVYDGKQTTHFVDGHPQPRRIYPYKFGPYIGTAVLWIGASPKGEPPAPISGWTGQIHHLRISSTARYEQAFEPKFDDQPDAQTEGLYRFDEGTGTILKDSSGHNRHGKIVGPTWVRPGEGALDDPIDLPPGSFLRFDGDVAGVEVPSLKFDGSHPLTIEAWVLAHDDSPRRTTSQIAGWDRYLTLDRRLEISPIYRFAGTDLEGRSIDGARGSSTESRRLHHIAGVWDGKKICVYYDGSKGNEADLSSIRDPAKAPESSSGPLTIGCGLHVAQNERSNFFRGIIDEVRISRTARYDGLFKPQPRFEPDADTMALYHFDEGSGSEAKDSSGHDHHGRIVGAVWGPAPVPRDRIVSPAPADDAVSLDFDGEQSYVEVDRPGLDLARPYTVEAWVTSRPSTHQTLALFRRGTLATHLLQNFAGPGWSALYTLDPSPTAPRLAQVRDSTPVPDGVLQHVAVVCDPGVKRATLFINGTPASQSPTATGLNVANALDVDRLTIGAFLAGSGTRNAFLKGRLHEFRVTQAARYSAKFTPEARLPREPETVLLYHCDEGAGAVLRDDSGRGHDGRIIGATWNVSRGPTAPTATGSSAASIRSLRFDGEKSRVEVAGLDFDSSRPYTVEAWVTPADGKGPFKGGPIINYSGPPALALWRSRDSAQWGSHVRFDSADSATENALRSVTNNFVAGERQHIALTVDPANRTVRMFHNGALCATQSQTLELPRTMGTPGALTIGSDREGQSPFAGLIDEVRISQGLRYPTPSPPPDILTADGDTVALYHFDEGSGDVLRDSSGRGHDGRIIDAVWRTVPKPATAQSVPPATSGKPVAKEPRR